MSAGTRLAVLAAALLAAGVGIVVGTRVGLAWVERGLP